MGRVHMPTTFLPGPAGFPASGRPGGPGSQYGRVAVYAVVDTSDLVAAGDRLCRNFHAALIPQMEQAASDVLEDVRIQLSPGHGYDTGLMSETLTHELVDLFEAAMGGDEGVFEDLGSHDAPYWVYVEFGHMTTAGNWWEGYHFMQQALLWNEDNIRRRAYEAWSEAVIATAAEARVAAPLMRHASQIFGPLRVPGTPVAVP